MTNNPNLEAVAEKIFRAAQITAKPYLAKDDILAILSSSLPVSGGGQKELCALVSELSLAWEVSPEGERFLNALNALQEFSLAAPSSAVQARCPKCGSLMSTMMRRISENSQSGVKLLCEGPELSYHEFRIFSLADFAQFFAQPTPEEK